MRRFIMSLAIAASLVAVSATTVLGHECFIFNRSAQGSIGADHSARWDRLTLATIFGFIGAEVGGPTLTPDQIDEAVALAVAQGLPEDGWVTRTDKVIGEGSKNPNLANQRGLDHLIDDYGNQIVGIYFTVLGS